MQTQRLRLTAQRRAVLDVVQGAEDHPSAAEIFQRVQQLHPGMAYGTVYTALRALVGEGLIRELKFGDGASRFDGRMEEHHHILCLACGALGEVDIALPPQELEKVSEQTGYKVVNHHIQFTGYCSQCRDRH